MMTIDADKEQVYYAEYDPVALKKVDTQHKVVDIQQNKEHDLFSILIVVDVVILSYVCSFIPSSLLNIVKSSHSLEIVSFDTSSAIKPRWRAYCCANVFRQLIHTVRSSRCKPDQRAAVISADVFCSSPLTNFKGF